MRKERIGFAMCGSFCTHEKALEALRELTEIYETVIPILSEKAAETDSRFGDAEELLPAMEDDVSELTPEELELYNEYNQAMMIDRNAIMVEKAIEYLESGETVFYAVGCAHLAGETGLLHCLEQAGYTITQVSYE